jgi:hypothetical protein
LLSYLFPLATVAVGVYILRYRPVVYVGYMWWIWLLSPAVRRLADYSAGWNAENPISLTPVLVSALVAPELLRRLPSFSHRRLFPLLLVAAGIGYGYVVGLARASVVAATYAMLTWLVPVLYGAYLALHWQRYPEHRAVLGRTFVWGVAITGLYGIAQFVYPMPWDQYWMTHVQMSSIGEPLPFQVRAFSLLNAPGPFGYVVAGHLLLLLGAQGRWRWFAGAVGLGALMLSLVRSAWIGLAAGAIVYVLYVPRRALSRRVASLATGLAVLVAMVVAVSAILPGDRVQEVVGTRFSTLGDVSSDFSFRERSRELREYVNQVATDFVGQGLGTTGVAVKLEEGRSGIRDFDNGVLEVFYTLGWPGATLFVIGLGWLFLPLLRRRRGDREDPFCRALRAAAVAMFVQSASGNVFAGVTGAALWTAVGALAAADRWWTSNEPERLASAAEMHRGVIQAGAEA